MGFSKLPLVGITKILRGIIRYRHLHRDEMVKQFKQVWDHPSPDAVFFCCMDSRMLPTRFTETCVGDMFVVRNAGNLVPHSVLFDPGTCTTEPAALEFGCVINNIRDIVVCGHSDCKAMNVLYDLRDPVFSNDTNLRLSPLKAWLARHAKTSLEKLLLLEAKGLKQPLEFKSENPLRKFIAYIDPEDRFALTDKLSQINTLQQVENIASYYFLKDGLVDGSIYVHALWFDIYSGDVFYFSRHQKKFVEINENSIEKLLVEVCK